MAGTVPSFRKVCTTWPVSTKVDPAGNRCGVQLLPAV
jgi:hypothetical protein